MMIITVKLCSVTFSMGRVFIGDGDVDLVDERKLFFFMERLKLKLIIIAFSTCTNLLSC
jgi:hypothetical protein